MIPCKNDPLENPDAACRVCGCLSPSRQFAVKKPASRAGIFYYCHSCQSWSFYPKKHFDSYDADYYGAGNSRVGGIAQCIRKFSANFRARFATGIAGSGECLDIGCGDGEFLKAMVAHGWSVKGTELPGPAFERANKKLPGQILGTAKFETTFLPSSYNLITMWQVFEHLENPRQVLGSCASLLIPGGFLAVGVPNPFSWQALWGKGDWLHFDPPRHLHLESLQTLLREAENLGFSCVTIRHPWVEFGPIGWIQTAMNKFGFPRDLFLEKMKDRWSSTSILSQILWILVAAALVLPAFFLSITESLNKQSATYEVYFQLGRTQGDPHP